MEKITVNKAQRMCICRISKKKNLAARGIFQFLNQKGKAKAIAKSAKVKVLTVNSDACRLLYQYLAKSAETSPGENIK